MDKENNIFENCACQRTKHKEHSKRKSNSTLKVTPSIVNFLEMNDNYDSWKY